MPSGPDFAATKSEGPLVTVKGLGKKYRAAWGVKDVSFQISRGEIFGVIGPNGAGKSTVLRMLAGLVNPSTGTAEIGGRSITQPDHRSRIGYLPEESALYEEMTPRAYLRFFAELYGVPAAMAKSRIDEAFTRLQLDVPRRARIGDLSKGMRRKVAIARSLVNDPELLIFDEPASGLDPLVSASLLAMLGELKARGKTIIFSAHNLFHVERVCDRLLILDSGLVRALGTMDEIRAGAGVAGYAVLSSVPVDGARLVDGGFEAHIPDLTGLSVLEALAASKGGRILEVRPRRVSLEDIFLSRSAR
ncbi:MAG: ABC transporter ATP-binding protein [Euryarchaeota archaeon]|nr:ABC transporter ATP-binding protein [Euryarchaeota archaeon]